MIGEVKDDGVLEQSRCFELAQHLQQAGRHDDATSWFREAHGLAPENWTYKRQAWSLADPLQGPTDAYDTDWLTDVQELGARTEGYSNTELHHRGIEAGEEIIRHFARREAP